jgi:hypothetical protein
MVALTPSEHAGSSVVAGLRVLTGARLTLEGVHDI